MTAKPLTKKDMLIRLLNAAHKICISHIKAGIFDITDILEYQNNLIGYVKGATPYITLHDSLQTLVVRGDISPEQYKRMMTYMLKVFDKNKQYTTSPIQVPDNVSEISSIKWG